MLGPFRFDRTTISLLINVSLAPGWKYSVSVSGHARCLDMQRLTFSLSRCPGIFNDIRL